MFKKYLLLLSAYGITTSQQKITKEIPAHLHAKLNIMDPKVDHIFVPTKHNLTEEDLKPPPRDTSRRKSHMEIRRVKDEHYEIEELEHNDILIDKEHIDEARKRHEIDLRKQRRLHAEQNKKEKEEFQDDEKRSEKVSDEDDLFEEEFGRDEKPENPDHQYLFNMIIKVHFRTRFNPDNNNDLHLLAGHIEEEMWVHEIHYQDVQIHEKAESVHILCNDHEEREHIRHILLKNQSVLLFYSEKKRYWTRFGDDDEKEHYKNQVEYDQRMRQQKERKAEDEHQRIERQIREETYQAELQRKIHAGDDSDKPSPLFGNYDLHDFESEDL